MFRFGKIKTNTFNFLQRNLIKRMFSEDPQQERDRSDRGDRFLLCSPKFEPRKIKQKMKSRKRTKRNKMGEEPFEL